MVGAPEQGEDNHTAGHANTYDVRDSHSSNYGPNGTVLNLSASSQLEKPLLDFARSLTKSLIASQEDRIGLLYDNHELDRLKVQHEQEIERLREQLAKAQGVIPALLRVLLSLEDDKKRMTRKRAEVERARAEEPEFNAELDKIERYLADLDAQQVRALTLWRGAQFESGTALQLWATQRMRWLLLVGPEPDMHDVSTAVLELPDGGGDEGNPLAHAQRVLDEAHKVLSEVHAVLEEVVSELYGTGVSREDSATPDPGQENSKAREVQELKRKLAKAGNLLKDYDKDAAERKKRQERELARRDRETTPPTTRMGRTTNGLLPGIGLFLLGVFFRQLPHMPELAGASALVVGAAMVILAVLPAFSIWKWSKDVDSTTRTTVAALSVFCVIAGNLSWVVALIPGLMALMSVLSSKKVNAVFVLTVALTAGLGAIFPGVMWWSWTGFDWVARVF